MIYRDDKATKVRAFLENFCTLSKSPWNGRKLLLLPWQFEKWIKPLYGTYRDDKQTRQFSRASLFIPKKQGKSSILSGLALYHLLEQEGSECYVIASDIAQASIIFNESANFVDANPQLKARLWVRRNIKAIEGKKGNSVLRVLSSTPSGKAGFNANFIAMDELCDWSPASHAREVCDQLANATMARKNGLQIVISTAQFNKAHVGYEEYDYAKKVSKDQSYDPNYFSLIYEVPENADWRDPENWWKANPSVPDLVPRDFYFEKFRECQNNPLAESRFRTLLLNQWVGSPIQFIASNVWSDCYEDFDESNFYGSPALVGVDFARKHDLASYVIVTKKDDKVYVIPRFFIPRESAKDKERKDNVPYLAWSRDPKNNLFLTDGDVIDPAFLRSKLIEDSKRFEIREVLHDPYAFEETRQLLEQDGLTCIEVTQNPKYLSPATAQLERLCIGKKLRHNNNDVLNWNLNNCVPVENRRGEITITKASDTQRIDGVDAIINALTRLEQLSESNLSAEDLLLVI